MPLKLLTFNFATSEWINPSESVLIKVYHHIRVFFMGGPEERKSRPLFHLFRMLIFDPTGSNQLVLMETTDQFLYVLLKLSNYFLFTSGT